MSESDKQSTECPLIKDNPGTCPFMKDIVALTTDVKWLKAEYKVQIGIGAGSFILLAGFILKVLEVI